MTEGERERYRRVRESVEAERGEILAEARRRKAAYDAAAADLHKAFEILKRERIAQGLSLADMRDRTGIGRSALSRLENDAGANPTIVTLTRYAEALGKKLRVVLTDRHA